MPKYVYGIVSDDAAAPSAQGIAGAPVHTIAGKGAVAVVSDVPAGELQFGRDEVLVHAEVLAETLSRGTVLPMRFGVVLEGSEEVRERLLDPHATELRDQLGRFEGKVELSVRAVYEEDVLMREVVSEHPEIARAREEMRGKPDDATYFERINLGEMVAGAVERKRESDANEILDQLAPVADAVVVSEPSHERIAVAAAFLVDRTRRDEFDAALDRVAAAQSGRIRFKSVGPLPPHSFVEFAGSG